MQRRDNENNEKATEKIVAKTLTSALVTGQVRFLLNLMHTPRAHTGIQEGMAEIKLDSEKTGMGGGKEDPFGLLIAVGKIKQCKFFSKGKTP